MKSRFWARIAATAFVAVLLGAALTWAGAPQPPAALADVNDFAVESFDAEYTLSRDETGRSSLHTVEHIVAVFPDFDQNRGLIRDLTRVYDGHETNLQVLSVTDETGAPRDFMTERYGDFLSVTMAVPEGQYVHGAQHYVIEYTQQDVTRFFEDTGVDEFYWDINGTGWTQPFGRVSARVVLSDDLGPSLTGDGACYYGQFGSGTQCALTFDGNTISAEVLNLTGGENVTVSIAFEQGTFAAAPTPPIPFLQRVPLLIWGGFASLAAAIVAFVVALVRGRGAKTGRAIIAQYEPPEGVSVSIAAEMLRAKPKAMTATLLDFAVRRKLRLLHHEQNERYGIQALDPTGLLPIEGRTYARLFGGSVGVGTTSVTAGETHWFSRTSTRLGDAAADLTRYAAAEAKRTGLKKSGGGAWSALIIVLLIVALGLPTLHALIFGNTVLFTILLAVGINALVWISLGIAILLGTRRRPSFEGALLIDHLKGLREYIRLAEADRIRMLQSVTGAEVDEQFVVQVYERLLPYAVLFGFEKEWQSELAKYYRETMPDWMYDTQSGSFMHALSMTNLARTVTSAPVTRTVSSSSGSGSGSSFSSFSGGSSGGGFSGGGGGGGGGRGI